MAQLQCILVTPETTVLDTPGKFVALPLFDGEIGIAPGHSPMIGRLGCGEMRLVTEAGTRSYYVEGGFVQVIDNTVSVLSARAVPADSLDAAVAEEQLATARARPSNTPELNALRQRAVAQARAQLHVAQKVGR